MTEQMYAVVRRDTGEAVAFGDFVQDTSHCICSHAEHVAGTETVESADGMSRERPLGCPIEGCWHNYAVPTKGLQVKRHVGGAPDHDQVLWSDPDGLADAPFVSDPLPDVFEAIPIDHAPGDGERWDAKARAVVPITKAYVLADLEAQKAAIDAAIAQLQAAN